ncbi:PGF-CTERM sorting domain-containing protein [Halosimplex amylolyticum]|uniref:PGF-CTERM sorting domain-containing protein n=1 Tax=Halosimplex amylolyticum TaxID=3396616 RepID=UPI003F5629FE
MDSDLTRRRLLASAGLAVSVGAASVAGATGTGPVEQPSNRALDPPEVRWNRAYGPRSYNNASALLESEDGDLIALGSAQQSQYGSGSDWLFSVDGASGTGRWSHLIERTEESFPLKSIVEADDGFVLLGGRLGNEQFSLRKVTADGEQSWRETYGPSIDGENVSMAALALQAVDDGYVVGGYVLQQGEETNADTATAVAIKVDAEGTEQWRHRFLEDRLSGVQSLLRDGDGFVASGILQDPPESEGDQPPLKSVLFRFDERGSVDWRTQIAERTEGEPNQANQIVDHAATEDGYLLVGVTGSQFETSPWVVAADGSGSIRTSRTLETDGSNQRHTLTSVAGDGDTAYVTGSLTNQETNESSAWLGAFDASTELAWSVEPARKQTNAFQDVVVTSDGGIAVAGRALTDDENAETPGEAWLVKLGGDAAPRSASTADPTDTSTPTATPTQTPTASPTPTAEPTATSTQTPTATPEDDGGETTSDGGPGFGVGAALAALGGSALLQKRGPTAGADADED